MWIGVMVVMIMAGPMVMAIVKVIMMMSALGEEPAFAGAEGIAQLTVLNM